LEGNRRHQPNRHRDREAAPVQLSPRALVRRQHPWTCTACPVHDPRTGELLGIVDINGLAETIHRPPVALVARR